MERGSGTIISITKVPYKYEIVIELEDGTTITRNHRNIPMKWAPSGEFYSQEDFDQMEWQAKSLPMFQVGAPIYHDVPFEVGDNISWQPWCTR